MELTLQRTFSDADCCMNRNSPRTGYSIYWPEQQISFLSLCAPGEIQTHDCLVSRSYKQMFGESPIQSLRRLYEKRREVFLLWSLRHTGVI